MNEPNAYRVELASGWSDIDDWWYGSNNPFRMCGYHVLRNGAFLVMEDVSTEAEAKLDAAPWCQTWELCRVDSPQVGDAEPEGEHEAIDAGDQLLWVS
jgi:hypothetical protein